MDIVYVVNEVEIIYRSWGYLLIYLSSFVEISPFGFLIPGGLLVALGGFFAYGSKTTFLGVIFFGWFGMMTTFYLGYFLGKKTGYSIAKRLHQEKFAGRAKILIEKHGAIILITSLMANLTRFWIAYVAGAQNYSLPKFTLYAAIASFFWNFLLVTVGYLAGSERQELETGLARLGILAWGLLILAIWIIYSKSKKEFSEIK
ncbi:hypothetical protein A2955_03775 [Candidatus Woesebacteria bacterium RIFCSPLOWO2_01_FULL_37_19]|uniref:VTT domain-containing protein n=2 Tax=Candidatus Woeseibacteriota TaxID=1752722 RepID=A0A1F8AY05_9BACT|nr:MAG: hypothetical protein A2771_03810 [Candidatus Woesebacteria bacterium RIFCSPHIGHO2_01_FULL_38_26b]OGM56621.1 MAG: hypothetical protein A2955_03775 [Candidatus Woesebacteria bacterium RIFCSPLOWO2_01_FULL_37_19]